MEATAAVSKETFTNTIAAALPVGLAQILNGFGDNDRKGDALSEATPLGFSQGSYV
jgi:hypothetical protein